MPFRVLCFICLLCGCNGSPDDAPVVAGGGYRGTFDGMAVITAHDDRDGSPIEGARVLVDGADVGTTGADGSIVVDGETIDRIEVSAGGYATVAYVGTDAEVVTVAMRRLPRDLASISGVVTGLDEVEVPAGATLKVRVGLAADGERIALPAPEIATCEGAGPCAFEATAMPGVPTRWFAQIDAVDDQGTPDVPGDDVVTPLSLALSSAVVAAPGEDVTDVRVEPFEASALAGLQIALPGPAPGIDKVVGVPGIGLGGALLFFGAHEGQNQFLLPAAAGEFDGSRRWAVALASRDDGAQSVSVVRAPAGEATTSLSAPTLRAIPALTVSGGQLDLSAAGPRAMVEVWEETEQRWTLVFDDRATLPVASPAQVFVWEAPAQTDGFALSTLRSTFTGWTAAPLAP